MKVIICLFATNYIFRGENGLSDYLSSGVTSERYDQKKMIDFNTETLIYITIFV